MSQDMSRSADVDPQPGDDPCDVVDDREDRLECQLDGDDLPLEEEGYGYGV